MSKVHTELLKRFCQPEWALFFEVRDATGLIIKDVRTHADELGIELKKEDLEL